MRSKFVFLGLSALVAISTVFACSSTTTTTNPAGEEGGLGTKEGGSDGGGGGKDTGPPVDTDSGPTDPDEACGAEATQTACATCCGPTNHAAGYKVFVDSLVECACGGTGADAAAPPCATDCAAGLCATPPAQPNATCNTCLQSSVNNGACAQHVSDECGASADCMAQQKCVAKCQGKPQ